MTQLFKLTDQDGYTRRGDSGETLWYEGLELSKQPCNSPEMCSPDVYHVYEDVNLAFLLNPIHANFDEPRLWLLEGEIVVRDFGKAGCFDVRVINEFEIPDWVGSDIDQQVRVLFAVLCAEAVLNVFEEKFSDDSRPRKAIEAAQEFLRTGAAADADRAADAAAADACAAACAAAPA